MIRLVAILLLVVPLPAAESLDLSSPDLIAEGSEQFAKSCAVGYCHGSEGAASARARIAGSCLGPSRAVSRHVGRSAWYGHARVEGSDS